MRKDVILGMSIGGVVLAVVIVYLTVAPSGKSNKHQVQLDTNYADTGSGGAGDVAGAGGHDLAETPVTPVATQDTKPTKPAADASKDAGKKPVAPKKEEVAIKGGGIIAPPASSSSDEKKVDQAGAGDEKAHNGGAVPKVVATNSEKADPKWGKLLWGSDATPLIGTSETPDPNAATAAALEAAGDQSSVSKRNPIVVPGVRTSPKVAETSAKAGASASGARQHTVTTGETFSTIALAAYGSSSYYPAILRANPQIDPRKLKPGMVINLPDPNEVKPGEAPEKAAATPTPTIATPAAHKVEVQQVDPKTEYRVQSGDSLNKIATKLYGRVDMVQKIYELNKGTIGADPAKLKLGMVLKLPEAPSVAAAGQ